MQNLIIGNWKENPITKKEAEELFDAIKKGVKGLKSEVAVCPPYVFLPALAKSNGGIAIGAQNVFYEEKGAFTGEISPAMLKDLSVEYVIVGHSERRKYFGETNEIINKKIKRSLDAGLKVIFCVGETQEEHDSGKKEEILKTQVQDGLKDIIDIDPINVAYEPVWAIGTGNNCSVEETKKSIDYIRQFVKPETRILYGGSVKSENSGAYIKEALANGLLVGGASLVADEFIEIVKSAE
jgi:triosephosphate isomerase